MCGITGIINFNKAAVDEQMLKRMTGLISYRGPDDEGYMTENNTGFGFVRLSIFDTTPAGHQPMTDASGRFTIVYNGAVYNYIEIRNLLKNEGYNFRSQSDTEVILYSYIHWGEACLNKFNGMWAFAIYDHIERSVYIARDRYGIKPLYYSISDEQFAFASDIPPLLSVMNRGKEADPKAIYNYLLYNRTDQDENTFYRHIKKLQHGHEMTIINGKISIKKWYDLSSSLSEPFSGPDQYRELLTDAIGLRLRSDVPVGVCLSGGLDSSTIVSVLNEKYSLSDMHTFSAIFGKDFGQDESEYIDEFRNKLTNIHTLTPEASEFASGLEEFLKAHSEPLPTTSVYAQYRIMQLASKYVTVLLDGQGADEQLAGYHYFFGFYFKELLHQLKLGLLLSEQISYAGKMKSVYGLNSMLFLLMPQRVKQWARSQRKPWISSDLQSTYSKSENSIDTLYNSPDLNSALINHFEYKLEHLLKWEDRNSMWFGIEARVPFLDHRIVEKTIPLPSNMKIRNGSTKYIMREAFRDILPEKIYNRHSKYGFYTPEDNWFRTPEFREIISSILDSAEFRNNPYIDQKIASGLYRKHLSGSMNIAADIWKWINLFYWLKV